MENYSKKQMNQYKLEYNKKFSLPFGSIFFAILAFPLALVFGKETQSEFPGDFRRPFDISGIDGLHKGNIGLCHFGGTSRKSK